MDKLGRLHDEISIILCTKEVANVQRTLNTGIGQYTVKMEHEITVIIISCKCQYKNVQEVENKNVHLYIIIGIPDYETNMATLYIKTKVLFF